MRTDITPVVRRTGYLTSQYPAQSHTFIMREVAALRSKGVDIATFSVRPPSDEELTDPAIAAEAETTFTVLSQRAVAFAGAHLSLLGRHPRQYAGAITAALSHRPPGLRGFLLALAHFAEAGLLAVELRRQGITHLHNHFANSAATVGYLAARLANLPWSFMIHGISETDYPAGITLAEKVRTARFVACASWFGRAQAMRVVEPEHWTKIKVVRCGVPIARMPKFDAVRRGGQIICVGRLSPEKGQSGLLDVFAAVRRRIPDAQLLLIGTGSDKERLRRQAAALALGDAVSFAGRKSEADTLQAIAGSDILVVPSFMEGLPIVLMEAMALGTAVIAPQLAGIPELVEDGNNGLLFAPSNWNELEAALERLLDDEKLRLRLAAEAKNTVARDFDTEQSASALQALFGDGQGKPEVRIGS